MDVGRRWDGNEQSDKQIIKKLPLGLEIVKYPALVCLQSHGPGVGFSTYLQAVEPSQKGEKMDKRFGQGLLTCQRQQLLCRARTRHFATGLGLSC